MTAWRPGQPVDLETERFRLCSLGADDVTDRYCDWLADPEIMTPLNRAATRRSRDDVLRYVAAFDNNARFHLGIFERDGDRLIGVYSISCDHVNGVAESNVLLGEKDWWGRHVVVETRAAVLDFLFGAVGMDKVQGRPLVRNVAAVAGYNALGFRCEGVLRAQLRAADGSRLDQYCFAMLRDEWAALCAEDDA